jgi:MbtH protein
VTDNLFDDAAAEFEVLVNHAAQYSLWPALRAPPPGWSLILPRASRQACLDWIDAQYKDMCPLLREKQ